MKTQTIYTFDGTFEGALTAVFESYARHQMPLALLPDGSQTAMGVQYLPIATDGDEARRVVTWIRRHLGKDTYNLLWSAFLYGDERCGDRIYRYIRLSLSAGDRVRFMPSDERVTEVRNCARRVWDEAKRLEKELRFSEMANGIYYAAVEPVHAVLPILTAHFADHFCERPFLLHDRTHSLLSLWTTHRWETYSIAPNSVGKSGTFAMKKPAPV